MSDNPTLRVSFDLTLDGRKAPAELMDAVREVSVESSLHLPDVATFTLLDTGRTWIDSDQLLPGRSIVIGVTVGNATAQLFDGEIVELEAKLAAGPPTVIVRAYDRLHRLSHGRKARSFVEVTDADVARQLAREARLKAEVEDTSPVHPYLLQADESDILFLRRRAAALGYLLYVEGETLHFKPPPAPDDPLELTWKEQLSSFRPRMSAMGQYKKVIVRGWDPMTRQDIVAECEKGEHAPRIGEERSGGEVVEDAFQVSAERLVVDRPVSNQACADALAKAVAGRIAGDFIQAEGQAGVPGLAAGTWIKVNGTGKRFDGTYLLTEVEHHYDPRNGYCVDFHVSGLRPGGLLPLLSPQEHRPSIDGLRIGIVSDNRDPEGIGRVRVRFPWLTGDHASDWARVAAPGGGPDRGLEFIPEVDDEVLVGFEFGDIHRPYILGGLWNGKNAPPEKSDGLADGGKIRRRIIRSSAGHLIVLDDSDQDAGITIQDRDGNRLAIASRDGALEISVQGDATVKARSVEISADGDISFSTSSGDVNVKGVNVKIQASANLDTQGANVSVSGSGSTAIKAGGAVTVSGTSISLG